MPSRRRRQHDGLVLVRPADGTTGATSCSRAIQGTSSDRTLQGRSVCIDVNPGMRAAASVAWEAAVKITLMVLPVSLLDRGYCSSVKRCTVAALGRCSSTYVLLPLLLLLLLLLLLPPLCCCGHCSISRRRWWSTGSYATESLVEQSCLRGGNRLCVSHGPNQLSQRVQTGKKNVHQQN